MPDFDTYLKHQFGATKQRKMAESDLWAVSLKGVRKELFYPVDQDKRIAQI